MLDIKLIREHREIFDATMKKRGESCTADALLKLDERLRHNKTLLQDLLHQRKELAKAIGQAASQQQDISELKAQAEALKVQIPDLESATDVLSEEINEILYRLPNILSDSVPEGGGECDNQLIRENGYQPIFDFQPKQHFDIGENLGQMDFKQAAKISGSRFVILKNELAHMERALANFMLDMHTRDFGYTEIAPPYLVSEETMFQTGQLPKFADDSFVTTNGFRLIPTAEIPVTSLVSDALLEEEQLPLRFAAYSPCFRSEAGSAGRDTRGMLRQHQFSKVELVSITRPQDSNQELERMTSVAEEVLKRLELSYRVMLLCSKDTGFCSSKTYDIEVWMPGQGCYREISSCSNCTDFQARRMRARYKEFSSKNNIHVHTLNGSALAIGRTIVAIIENYQQEGGSVKIPQVLQPYMGGKELISL